MALIKLRRDTAANWTSANPTLAEGEPGLETDTGKIKYGDGASSWTQLNYSSSGSSTIVASTNTNATITTTGYNPSASPAINVVSTWTFNYDGDMVLPAQGDILYSNGSSAIAGNITNEHDGSSTIIIGQQYAHVDDLNVRIEQDVANNIVVEMNYNPSSSNVTLLACTTNPITNNIYNGSTVVQPGNQTWTQLGTFDRVGSVLSFVVTDVSYHKTYRTTVISRTMPSVGTAGDAYCIIERLM